MVATSQPFAADKMDRQNKNKKFEKNVKQNGMTKKNL